MRGEPLELECPFCGKGNIRVWYIPGVWSFKRKSTKTLPGHGTLIKSKDIHIIQSGCDLCGKSKEEVEKELKKRGVI
jgi:hypothetical protein